ncbi:MAG: hypothetical protein A2087_11050 [Spirochaetes bacterium GWD1_61_31]|nr:MAG: hypothetical protein A2Y37_10000 [Spirochaetes bacterium GWB1_60_80]OHD29086.1 MAG: hypothetical protein A2004_14650 [Spirochaetes bacterium GWC1_61_12]OHD43117.1 MAG: hypothetical protein A2087_11050 [Spirochaetes bacterium GWD1_61_31]OHD44251.1 MAG: hypothetical protein A2Y35_06845 [Spirochaetes bacterium GWE1_60_18]OHD60389.1 MAG: hypothetical protein A2Y32_00680 [Spirochaetes bacterium GWF1_60_12]HAP43295.1 MerR family transcriptional regulator [Spirochaetaceae bacterium]
MPGERPETGPYRTGQIVELLAIPEHVLRYWEKALPFLAPQRSFGRRQYSPSEVALLCRVRHLVRQRGLGLEAVQSQLLAERSGEGAEWAARLTELRVALIEAWFASRRLTARVAGGGRSAPLAAGQP